MTTINGVMDHTNDTAASANHLGKRKRSSSPEKKVSTTEQDTANIQHAIRQKLQSLSSSGPVSSLLNKSLPSNETNPPYTKRARLSSAVAEDETIGKRISSDFYTSIEQVRQDLLRVRDAFKSKELTTQVNGEVHDPSPSPNTLDEAANKVAAALSSVEKETTSPRVVPSFIPSTHRTGQVITLRSQTEKGIQLLYSGLQKDDGPTGAINTLDGRKLPNGFDLTDAATMDTSMLAPTKDRRLFGDVFRPNRLLKQLEAPRNSRPTNRSNVLGFTQEPDLERATTLNRSDYKFQQLPVGTWLTYSLSDQQSNRRLRGKSFAQGDFRAALMANDVAPPEHDDESALFRRAFSSFAPTTDTSKAVVSEIDKDRHWYSKYGSRRLRNVFKAYDFEESDREDVTAVGIVSDNDFTDVVTNFQPEESQDVVINKDNPESIDEVLNEVSELLETLHSYQHIRNSDSRATASTAKPSSAEFDSYELLRSQLAILIASLPPFAVARLDGDKLNDLNISTTFILDTPDFRGTAQPDEYTLSRYRAAQPAAAPAARPQPATQLRPTYQTPSIPRYNTNNNLQAYAQNLGVAANRYNQGANYQTPRTYQQTPFQQSNSNYSAQPTVQQFQRPTSAVNGYSSYNSQGQTQQTPSQPGYQQNAQSKMAYGMNHAASPSKPNINGQTAQQFFGTGQSYQRTQQQASYGSGTVNGAGS